MKQITSLGLLSAILVLVIVGLFILFQNSDARAAGTLAPTITSSGEDEPPIPTPEFIPTSAIGAEPSGIVREIPTLTHPLSREQAIERVLELEQTGWVRWENPWSHETLSSDPDRIKIESFPSITDYKVFGELPDDKSGPVWVITAKGSVQVTLIGGGCKCNGVIYVISERTGFLMGITGIDPEPGESSSR